MVCENCGRKTYCIHVTKVGKLCPKCEDERRKSNDNRRSENKGGETEG